MKKIYGLFMLAIFSCMVFMVTPAVGLPETTVDLTIGPGGYDGSYLPALESDTIDVKMTSNIPVDVYIINSEQVYNIDSGSFDFEEKWEGKTSLNVDYKVGNMEEIYYILIINPSDSETANVELEYKLYQEIGEEIVEDACCGSTMIIGVMSLLGLVIGLSFLRKRNN